MAMKYDSLGQLDIIINKYSPNQFLTEICNVFISISIIVRHKIQRDQIGQILDKGTRRLKSDPTESIFNYFETKKDKNKVLPQNP